MPYCCDIFFGELDAISRGLGSYPAAFDVSIMNPYSVILNLIHTIGKVFLVNGFVNNCGDRTIVKHSL